MIHIPIEQRYDKNKAVFHSSAFAIAAGVVAVGGATASGIMASQAAGKAAANAAAAGKKLNKQQRKALAQYTQSLAQVQAPQWDVARDIKDAGQITDYNIGQLEKIFPGAKTQREIASRATESLLRGEIPRDVQEQIMRSVAELGGAGFQPSAAPTGVLAPSGFQASTTLLPRMIAKTSFELQQLGMQSNWRNMAEAFRITESPLRVGQARLAFEESAANIQMRKAEGLFGAQTGVAQSQYDVAQSNIANRLAADQANVQMIQGITSAASGALGGIGSAYQGLSAAQGSGTMYGSLQSAQQAAPYAASFSNVQGMGFVPRAQPVSASATRALTGAYG